MDTTTDKSSTKSNSKESTVIASATPCKEMSMVQELQNHLAFSSFKTDETATPRDWYVTTAHAVRDHVVERWVKTSNAYYEQDPKRVYYLSLEFLMGRMLSNAALNLNIAEPLREGLHTLGHEMEDVVEMETDAALGNGGVGGLAACFLDSMATMNIPGTGYGIRYEYGMFRQAIVDSQQVEHPDNWLRYGNVWE